MNNKMVVLKNQSRITVFSSFGQWSAQGITGKILNSVLPRFPRRKIFWDAPQIQPIDRGLLRSEDKKFQKASKARSQTKEEDQKVEEWSPPQGPDEDG